MLLAKVITENGTHVVKTRSGERLRGRWRIYEIPYSHMIAVYPIKGLNISEGVLLPLGLSTNI